MKDFICLYVNDGGEYSHQHQFFLGAYRNTRQIESILTLLKNIKDFLKKTSYNINSINDIYYEYLNTETSDNKRQVLLYRESSCDYNFSYHYELASIVSDLNIKALEEKASQYINEDSNINNAGFEYIDIKNSLTRKDIYLLAEKMFGFNQQQFDDITFLLKNQHKSSLYQTYRQHEWLLLKPFFNY